MLRLKVLGMTCEGCATSVKRAISTAVPDARVEVDLAAGEAGVEGPVWTTAVRSAISSAGFNIED